LDGRLILALTRRRDVGALNSSITTYALALDGDLNLDVTRSFDGACESPVAIGAHSQRHGAGEWRAHLEEMKAAVRVGHVETRVVGIRLNARTADRRT
jgi:hypothetical protein